MEIPMGIPMSMGMILVWAMKSNPHGYSSPGNRRSESKRTTYTHRLSRITGYATA